MKAEGVLQQERIPGPDSAVGDSQVVQRQRYRTEPLGYVDSLDGLRGYSMVAVMLYHARFTLIPGGFLAVSIFFTLSGFLITSLLIREWAAERAISMRAFWSRRFRRLIPAAWLTMAGVLALGALGLWDGDQLSSLRGDLPFSLLQVVNWHYILEQRTYGASFVAPSPLEHYWSLAVEEQFYLLLPLTVLILFSLGRHRSMRWNLQRLALVFSGLIVVGAVLNGVLARGSIDRAYFGTDTRMPEMVAGALLACGMARTLRYPEGTARRLLRALGVAGLLGIAALWIFASLRAQWMYPWGLLITSVVTCAVIAGSLQGGLADRFLSFAPAARLGRMSYGTYLVHWPVFLILTPVRTGLAPVPLFALRFVVSVTLSTLLYHFVEEPVRRRRVLLAWRFPTVLAAILPVLLIGTFFVTAGAQPSSVIQRDPTGAGAAGAPRVAKKRILLVGDRMVQVLAQELGTGSRVGGRKVSLVIRAAAVPDCGLISGGWLLLPDGRVERDVARCADAASSWAASITAERPDLVVVFPTQRDAAIRRADSISPWEAPSGGEQSFAALEIGRTLDTLTEAANGVGAGLVLAASPEVTLTPPEPAPPRRHETDPQAEQFSAIEEAMMIESAPDPSGFPSLSERVSTVNLIAEQVAANRGIEFVDPLPRLRGAGDRSVTIDATAAPVPLPAPLRRTLTGWLASVALRFTPRPPVAAPVPDNLRSVVLPPAPPVTPRATVPAGEPTALLVVGDSLAYGLGFGLEAWAKGRQVDVTVAAQFGCPIARGGRYRFQRDSASFETGCDWGPTYPELVSSYHPQVVMLSSSVWQVVDRQLPGDDRYRHIGDELMDRFILSEFLTVVDVLASGGATVALLTAPHIDSGREKGYSGLAESQPERVDRMNELIREVAELRPGVTRLIDLQGWLAEQPGREMDPVRRPDGVHFTDAEARSIADWLGPQLVALAQGG